MSVDMSHALRHEECLTNPSRMQAARWMSVDTKQALRLVSRLANPSAIPGARWGKARLDTKQALRLVMHASQICKPRMSNADINTPASTPLSAIKWLKTRTGACV